MFDVSWVVKVEGRVVEDQRGPDNDIVQITSLDALVNGIRERWGKNCEIELLVWRANWRT